MKNTNTGIKRIISAGSFSASGLIAAYRNETAFRQETWLAIILIPLALWLGETWPEKTWLIASVLLLLIVELLNSAIETVVDRVGDEYHELSGRAKDMGSAAVLLTIILTAMVWITTIFT